MRKPWLYVTAFICLFVTIGACSQSRSIQAKPNARPAQPIRFLKVEGLRYIGKAVFFTEGGEAYVYSNPGASATTHGLYKDVKVVRLSDTPGHCGIVLTRDDAVLELRPVGVPVCAPRRSTVQREAGGDSWIECIEVPSESGDLWVGLMQGRVTTVTSSLSQIAGVITDFAGMQTLVFRNRAGDEFRCPGVFHFGLGNFFAPTDERNGGCDWAFAIDRQAHVPEWVDHLAAQRRVKYPNNIFLTTGRNFSGVVSGTVAKPGDEFGPGKRLLTIGVLSPKDWSISID